MAILYFAAPNRSLDLLTRTHLAIGMPRNYTVHIDDTRDLSVMTGNLMRFEKKLTLFSFDEDMDHPSLSVDDKFTNSLIGILKASFDAGSLKLIMLNNGSSKTMRDRVAAIGAPVLLTMDPANKLFSQRFKTDLFINLFEKDLPLRAAVDRAHITSGAAPGYELLGDPSQLDVNPFLNGPDHLSRPSFSKPDGSASGDRITGEERSSRKRANPLVNAGQKLLRKVKSFAFPLQRSFFSDADRSAPKMLRTLSDGPLSGAPAREASPPADSPLSDGSLLSDALLREAFPLPDSAPEMISALHDNNPVTCYFHAEMDDTVIMTKLAPVEVIVSREHIEATTSGVTTDTADGITVDKTKAITVILRATANVRVEGEDRKMINIPEPNAPVTLIFAVRATHAGPGEVQIEVFQDQFPLCTLTLSPSIAATDAAPVKKISQDVDAPATGPFEEQLHQLRITEQKEGDHFWYTFELDSPLLDEVVPYASDRLGNEKLDKVAFVNTIYTNIEQLWEQVAFNPAQFQDELCNYGGTLYDQLMPKQIKQFLWDNMDKIQSIQVLSTEPFIPWELVLIKDPSGTGRSPRDKFLGELGLIRWLYGARSPQQLFIRPNKAKYVIPDYLTEEYRLPGAQQEKTILKDLFNAEPVDPYDDKVKEQLKAPAAFDLLHFACHGGAELDNIMDSRLMLKEREVQGKYYPTFLTQLTVEQLGKKKLVGPDGIRPIVVLNACQTGRIGFRLTGLGGFAKAFLDAGASTFIGALWSVGDAPALEFITTLYGSLKDGRHLSQATVAARKAAKGKDATWIAYAVYGHPFARLKQSTIL